MKRIKKFLFFNILTSTGIIFYVFIKCIKNNIDVIYFISNNIFINHSLRFSAILYFINYILFIFNKKIEQQRPIINQQNNNLLNNQITHNITTSFEDYIKYNYINLIYSIYIKNKKILYVYNPPHKDINDLVLAIHVNFPKFNEIFNTNYI